MKRWHPPVPGGARRGIRVERLIAMTRGVGATGRARRAPVGDVEACRAVRFMIKAAKVPRQRERRPAGAKDQRFRPGVAPVVCRKERIERQTCGEWVNRAAVKVSIAFVEAAQFAHRFRERVEHVELVAARVEQIDLVAWSRVPRERAGRA